MRGSLLNERSEYESNGFATLDIGNDNQSTKWYSQPKRVKTWAYYGHILLTLTLAILCIVFAAGWAAADHKHEAGVTPDPPPTPTPEVRQDLPNVILPIIPYYPDNTLMGQVKTYQLINLLSGVYRIAMENGGNRAIGQPGHNATVDFLLQQIAASTSLVDVERTYFLRNSNSRTTAKSISVLIGNESYALTTDFSVFSYSQSITDNAFVPLFYVPNACDSTNWPTNKPAGRFWVISPYNGTCRASARVLLASNYGAYGVVVLSSTPTSSATGDVSWWLNSRGIGINRADGNEIIWALGNGTSVTINANYVETHTSVVISNICGDTPIGDPQSTVLVGGHSDGVSAGPGTNDDGSGSIATLVLAIGVSNLIKNGTYANMPNKIKFCWFGGEEAGLLGSIEVVRQGLIKNNDPNARPGTRAKDWAMMIDLDMLGSMNYQNMIYDANNKIPSGTPQTAFNGSKTQTNLFFDFFKANNLPCDSDAFDGRSDYGPFLEVGIPAGGVDAGADKVKNETTRQRYQNTTGWGGVANKQLDQCYHRPCDTIANIHWGVFTNMTMSAAYVTEIFALRQNLREWIEYPYAESMPDPMGARPFEFKSRPKHWTEDDEMW